MFLRSPLAMAGLFALVTGCFGRSDDTDATTGSNTGSVTGAVTGTATGGTTNLPTGGTTGSATGGTATTFSCANGPTDLGPWPDGSAPAHPIAAAGASVTTDLGDLDANVQGVIDAAAGNFDDTYTDVTVTGAIVYSVGYVPAKNDGSVTFWFGDANGVAQGYRLNLLGFDPLDLKPGDEINLHATVVKEYFGTPEVIEVDSFEVVSSGNDVYVADGMAGLDLTNDFMRNVEVYGEIVSGPTDCYANCFQLDYGGQIVTFRTQSAYIEVGDCVHWIGPLGEFGGAAQLNADNFDWYRWF